MSSRFSDPLLSFFAGLVLAAAPALTATPAAAAAKEPERTTQGRGPAMLTAAERAKAEAAGIRITEPDPAAVARVQSPPAPVEHLLRGTKPTDFGTRLPAVGLRDRRKPGGLGPTDFPKQGARP